MRIFLSVVFILVIVACDKEANTNLDTESKSQQKPVNPVVASDSPLQVVLNSQAEDIQARYGARHPEQTLTFFDIQPGATVVEYLPGGGWYSKILLPYLGQNGRLIGVDYALEMWRNFSFADDNFIEQRKNWTQTWQQEANGWSKNGATVSAFISASMPESLAGTADYVLFIRALHNLARFENDGGYLTSAISEAYTILKPGGIVGVVQHEARENMPDDWANGENGYIKKAFVIEKMQAAGFEFVAESNINNNVKDQPTETDMVWRIRWPL